MKIRFGFISNSSSTSFVCPVCGHSNFGWDWDEDPICVCGAHIFKCTVSLADYLIVKYNLDKKEEMEAYIKAHNAYNPPDREDEYD